MHTVKFQNSRIINKLLSQAGFSLIEILLAGSVFIAVITFLVTTILYGEESTMLAGNRGQASILAEEGLEAARNIRDGDGFAALSVGTHGLAISSNEWIFSGSEDVTDDFFTREIEISEVDTDRKEITATVTWDQNAQRSGEIVLSTYFTNWQDNVGQGSAGDNLVVDISALSLDPGDNTKVTGITIENTGSLDSTITEIIVDWVNAPGGTKLQEISIDGSSVWNGNSNSGVVADITDFILIAGAGTYPIDFIDFSKEMSGATITVTFVMSDASTKDAVITLGADITPPAAVSDLATSNATTDSIDLTWTAPGDDGTTGIATSYDVRYSTSTITDLNWGSASTVDNEPTPALAGSSESMTISGLDSNTNYYFAIKTSDEVPNESELSNIASGSTVDITPPAAITDLATSNITANSIRLTWTAPGDDGTTGTASVYDVRYASSTITEGNWSLATQVTGEPTPSVAGSSESMTVSGLSGDTTYYFAIKTLDEVPNTSDISNVPNAKTLDLVAPAAITNLLALSPTTSAVTLSWTAPGDNGSTGTATSYDVRYSSTMITELNWASAAQAVGEPVPSAAGSNQSMTVSGLSGDTTYYFAIKTLDEVPNTSDISNVVDAKTLDLVAPAAVTNLLALSPTTSTVALSWTAPGDNGSTGTATSYDVRYSSSTITELNWASATQAVGEPVPSAAGSNQSMTVTGLNSGITYYFAIKTSDEVPNISTLSNIASAATLAFVESNYLVVDTTSVAVNPSNNKQVIGIGLSNNAEQKITISTMIVSWTGGSSGNNIQSISIGGAVAWSGNGKSGDKLDIKDFVLDGGQNYKLDYLDFKKSISGATLELIFLMSDASTKTVSNIRP